MVEEEKLHLGGDLTAWCHYCGLVTEHLIVESVEEQPALVECTNCGELHMYRRYPPAATGEARKEYRDTWKKMHPAEEWQAMVEERRSAGKDPVPYSASVRLEPGDLVESPMFGTGVVLRMHGQGKAEIRFRNEVRVLICSRSQ